MEFNTFPKYLVIREKLKKTILRIAVEKHKRTVGSKGMTPDERDKFKADLYCFLNEQMKQNIDQAIENLKNDGLH